MFATMALGKLLSGAQRGSRSSRSNARIATSKGRAPQKRKARRSRPNQRPSRKPNPKPGRKEEGRSQGADAAGKSAATAAGTGQRESLEAAGTLRSAQTPRCAAGGIQQGGRQKQEAIKEWDAARDKTAVETARAKAREANQRADRRGKNSRDSGRRRSVQGTQENRSRGRHRGHQGGSGESRTLPCFATDTPVWTPDGLRRIAELRAGIRSGPSILARVLAMSVRSFSCITGAPSHSGV